MNVQIELPILHPKQREIEGSPAKRKFVATGRRFGKTTLAAVVGVRGFLQRKRILYAAPVETQTEAFWRYCKEWLAPLYAFGMTKNETLRQLEMPGLGVIRAKTAFHADTLRGDFADILILDEFSYMDADVWGQVGAPMLLDNDGDAYFIFSPAKRNHAYLMFRQAQADTTGRWRAWHGTTHDNPHLPPEAIRELTQDMTDEDYRQEIMAEFLEGQGAIFRFIEDNLYDGSTGTHAGHRLVAGIDWGQKVDYSCVSIGCADCLEELALERWKAVDYPTQQGRVKTLYERWSTPVARQVEVLAEANAMGEPNIQALRLAGIPVRGFTMTHASKAQAIQSMRLAFEQKSWKWLSYPWATQELEVYECRVTIQGTISYGAPATGGLHDDTVTARALMLHRAQVGGITWLK